MKIRNSTGKKPGARESVHRASRVDALNLPRVFLFLEVFVEKEVAGRSTK
jgi:hypothetical protein